MTYPNSPVKIAYRNASGAAFPPYSIVQFSGDCEIKPDGTPIVSAILPDGKGPYAIDCGGGAGTGNSTKYGTCVIPFGALVPVRYNPSTSDPGTAWTQGVGAVSGQSYGDNTGNDFLYGGVYEPQNNRVWVTKVGGGSISVYVVTQYGLGPGGPNENEAITCSYGIPFKAKPYESGVASISSLRGKEIKISPRMITGAIFTGQAILVSPASPAAPGTAMDVVGYGNGFRYRGSYIGTTSGVTTADIQYTPQFTNAAATRPLFARVTTFAPQFTLTAQQLVLLDVVNNSGVGFRISEFSCAGTNVI